jgi:hypothetical protein
MVRVKRDWCPDAIDFLRAGLDLGPEHDMRSGRVYAALDYLETQLGSVWPIVTFRRALEIRDTAARWRCVEVALPGIAEAVAVHRHTLTKVPA